MMNPFSKLQGFTPFLVILVLLALLAGGAALSKHHYEVQLAQLRNQVAARDQTIEVQKGLFSKLTLEVQDTKSLLSSKDEQVKALLNQVKTDHEDLLTANQLVVRWKAAYEGKGTSTQTETTDPGTKVVRKRVNFHRDFGTIGVSGYTLTDPADSWLKVEQLKPLQLTVAVSQDKSGAWHSYVTSNDDNQTVDIRVASVDPFLFRPRWYEKIQLNTVFAGGQSGLGFGLLAGVGVSYKFNQFDIGPAVFISISDRIDKYFGATFAWRPFEK